MLSELKSIMGPSILKLLISEAFVTIWMLILIWGVYPVAGSYWL
jgi:hypothetical protein